MKYQKFYVVFGKPVTNEAEIRVHKFGKTPGKCSLFLAGNYNPVNDKVYEIDERGVIAPEQAKKILEDNGFLPVEEWIEPFAGDKLPEGVSAEYIKAFEDWKDYTG